MFAIIKTGGKQYKVATNDIIKIEKLVSSSGDSIEFTEVLMMGKGDTVKVGAPLISHARVVGTVLDQIRDDKVIIFKKKRRHNYRRKNGHRQYLTVVRITDILAEGEAPKAKAAPVKAVEKAEKPVQTATPKVVAPKAAPAKTVAKASVKKAAPQAKATESPEKSASKAKPKPKK